MVYFGLNWTNQNLLCFVRFGSQLVYKFNRFGSVLFLKTEEKFSLIILVRFQPNQSFEHPLIVHICYKYSDKVFFLPTVHECFVEFYRKKNTYCFESYMILLYVDRYVYGERNTNHFHNDDPRFSVIIHLFSKTSLWFPKHLINVQVFSKNKRARLGPRVRHERQYFH